MTRMTSYLTCLTCITRIYTHYTHYIQPHILHTLRLYITSMTCIAHIMYITHFTLITHIYTHLHTHPCTDIGSFVILSRTTPAANSHSCSPRSSSGLWFVTFLPSSTIFGRFETILLNLIKIVCRNKLCLITILAKVSFMWIIYWNKFRCCNIK